MKHVPPALAHLSAELEGLRVANRLRQRATPQGGLSFCSNDYLGLAINEGPITRSGAGASRLIAGDQLIHGKLEEELAAWLRVEGALLFSSGYAANVGALGALLAPNDRVVSDALNHASIIDGIRLSRASDVIVTPHLDLRAVQIALDRPRNGRAWVVTESYFSMDADSPDLGRLRAICDATGAGLIVDEAHAFGVLGPEGRGLCHESGVLPDVWIGTLGKAFGAAGAFVAGCDPLIAWLWNRARSFVFSTGISPAIVAAAAANFRLAREQPALRTRVLSLAARFRTGLRQLEAETLGHGPIVPWLVGSESRALQAAERLQNAGVHVVAIRPPTVPEGTSRLRFAITAAHDEAAIDAALQAVADLLPTLDVSRETSAQAASIHLK